MRYNARGGPFYAVADAYAVWRDLSNVDVMAVLSEAKRLGMLNFNAHCIP